MTARKTLGVASPSLGVCAALAAGLATAPPGAWRGELIMTGAVLCMAFYNVWSRPFIQRSSALGFLAVGMGAGALALVVVGLLTGRLAVLQSFGAAQWIAGIYLGVARRRARVHSLGDGAAARLADPRRQHHDGQSDRRRRCWRTQLVGEPITLNLLLGLVAVFAGIWIATTEGAERSRQHSDRSVEASPRLAKVVGESRRRGRRATAAKAHVAGRSPPLRLPSTR